MHFYYSIACSFFNEYSVYSSNSCSTVEHSDAGTEEFSQYVMQVSANCEDNQYLKRKGEMR